MIVHFWYRGIENEFKNVDSVRFNDFQMIITDSNLDEHFYKAKKVIDLSIEHNQDYQDPFCVNTTWDTGAIESGGATLKPAPQEKRLNDAFWDINKRIQSLGSSLSNDEINVLCNILKLHQS